MEREAPGEHIIILQSTADGSDSTANVQVASEYWVPIKLDHPDIDVLVDAPVKSTAKLHRKIIVANIKYIQAARRGLIDSEFLMSDSTENMSPWF